MKIPACSLLLISSNPVACVGNYNGGVPPAFIVDNGVNRKYKQKYMALTEEFIRIKEGNGKQVDNSSIDENDSKRSVSDALGYSALNTVKLMARSTGIGEKFGSNSTRSEFINWQRENLREVRRDVGKGTLLQSRDTEKSSDRESDAKGVRKMLINALPSNNQSSGQSNKKRGRRSTDNKSDDRPTTISTALQTLERDMTILDNLASLQPQLSLPEVGLLLGAVTASGIGPIVFPGTSVTEVLAPAAAAFTASITIGSEYIGRVAVADGKEIAANAIQCAAEAEAFLANAERVKAITPLCVGLGATCASFALLTPTLVEVLNLNSVQLITQLYIFCPLVAILSAAVANLALEETRDYSYRAINVGVRRFSKGGDVGRTWLSSAEQIQRNSRTKTDRWWSFAGSVLPAPIIGSIFGPPALSAKCIVVAALAAAQSAYFLALAEGVLARATDAVAIKARSAAVCDTYANQGSRNSAILPFTSALSAFCAAATAAMVELPFIDAISAAYGTIGEVCLVVTFPILSSAFAAAASVSKARCEVDAEAACQAASTLALEYDAMNGNEKDPVLRPFKSVLELIILAVNSGWRSVKVGLLYPMKEAWGFYRRLLVSFRWNRRWDGRGKALSNAAE
ncbi:hypothetical protein ACHAWO_011412 [Cyclotella atomus]|uniref:H(+)-exporting diphosphatase n=1 Tax=Cyclotella atomus TaxID=382360 RepID=A0ABD3NTK4_9STRA